MADNKTQIVLTAVDQTQAAFASVGAGLKKIEGAASGLNTIASRIPALGAALGAALGGASIAGFVKGAVDAADALNDMSQRTGIAVRDLAAYKLAAEQSGASLESVGRGVKGLATYMAENGKALQAAGITAKDANGALRQIADQFASMPDGIEKSAIATKLFGKAGQDLIPLLNLGSKGLDDSAKAAEEYGRQMSLLAPQADALNDQLALLKVQTETLGVAFANGAIAPLVEVAKAMSDGKSSANAFTAAGEGVAVVFETIAALGINVAYVFNATGRELGGIAAQMAALATGDFSGFSRIGEVMREEAEQARKEVDALTDRILNARQRLRELPAAVGGKPGAPEPDPKPSPAVKAAASAYDQLSKSIRERIAVGELELQQGAKLTPAQQAAAKFTADIASGTLKLTEAEKIRITGLLEQYIAVEKNIDAAEAAKKAAAEWFKEIDRQSEAQEKVIRSLEDHAAKLEEEVANYGKLGSEIEATTIARLEEQLRMEAGGQARADVMQDLEDEIKARRRIRDAMASKEGLDASKQAGEEVRREWEKAYDDISRSLTDSLMRGGKNAGEYLKDYFRTLVLRPVIQGAVQQSGIAAFGSGFSGGTLNALGAAGNLTSLLGGITGAAGLASGVLAAGQFLGSATLANFGAGMYAGATGGFAASGAVAANAGATSAAGIGSTLGAAMPYIAAAVIAYEMLATKRTPHVGGFAQVDAEGNVLTNEALRNRSVINGHRAQGLGGTDFRTSDFSQQGTEAATSLARGAGVMLEGIARSFGLAGGFTVGTGFADDSSKDGAWGGLRIQRGGQDLVNWSTGFGGRSDFADGAAGFAQYQGELGKSIRDVLDGMDLPGWADEMLAKLGASASLEDLTKTVDAINQTQAALDALRPAFTQLGITGDEVILKLVEGMGGLQAASGAIGSYIEAIYTPAEKLALQQDQLADAFEKLGLAVPTTSAAYRALVEEQLALGESGAAAAAQLMALAPAFAQIAASADAAAQQIAASAAAAAAEAQRAADAEAARLAGIASQRTSLQADLLDAQGNSAGALAARRAIELAGLDESLRPLQQQIYDALDASAARAEAQRLAEAAAAESARQQEAAQRAADQAAQEAARAFEEQQRAAEQLREAWQRVTDSIADTVRELRGELVSPDRSFAKAQADFAIASAQAGAGDQDAAGRLPQLAKAVVELGKSVSSASIDQALLTARTIATLQSVAGSFARFGITVPAFAVGTDFVPADMLAKVHAGERIIPAADNRALMRGLAAQGDLVGEVIALRNELAALRADNSAENRAIAGATAKTARTLDRFDDGDALRVRTAV